MRRDPPGDGSAMRIDTENEGGDSGPGRLAWVIYLSSEWDHRGGVHQPPPFAPPPPLSLHNLFPQKRGFLGIYPEPQKIIHILSEKVLDKGTGSSRTMWI